jgi:hypothetical protein
MADTVEEFLEHFGVKGMKWGVRKDRSGASGQSSSNPGSDHAKLKKAAKIGGGVLAAAAVTAGAIYLAKHPELLQSAAKSLSGSSPSGNAKDKARAENFVHAMSKEPTSLIHTSNDKGFLLKGGLPDALFEYEKAGFERHPHLSEPNSIRRYGKNAEKVAAILRDPEGRKDPSGRPINHHLIIPESQAHDIHTIEDVKTKIWPQVKGLVNEFHNSPDDRQRQMIRENRTL